MVKIEIIKKNGIQLSDGRRIMALHVPGDPSEEFHWADQRVLLRLYETDNKKIAGLSLPDKLEDMIEKIPGIGFCLKTSETNRILIPCYGLNRGYYTANLIIACGKKNFSGTWLDISDCQKVYRYRNDQYSAESLALLIKKGREWFREDLEELYSDIANGNEELWELFDDDDIWEEDFRWWNNKMGEVQLLL